MKPFFTVIIPTFNRAEFIKRAVDSVLMQAFKDYEIIVVDDGSTDETLEILRDIKDKRIKIVAQSNRGVAHARNQGIKAAQAEWMCFLDSDDEFLPSKLNSLKTAIEDNKDSKIFHTNEVWIRDGKEQKQSSRYVRPHGKVFEEVLDACVIGMSTSCVHRYVFDQVGLFDERFEACEDYEFWLRATLEFDVHLIEDALTVKHGGRSDQLSKSVWGLDRFRVDALDKIMSSGQLNERQAEEVRKHLKTKCDIVIHGAVKYNNREAVDKYTQLMRRYGDD